MRPENPPEAFNALPRLKNFWDRAFSRTLRFFKLIPTVAEDAPDWKKQLTVWQHLEDQSRHAVGVGLLNTIYCLDKLNFWETPSRNPQPPKPETSFNLPFGSQN